MARILLTGMAGFIGYHLSNKLLSEGYELLGIDNLNSYYDIRLKLGRLQSLGFESVYPFGSLKDVFTSEKHPELRFAQADVADASAMKQLFEDFKPQMVIHLAAQAGVRYSLENPQDYINSNISGFLNILEQSKNQGVHQLFYASSSSVYGLNENTPFKESDTVEQQANMYAVSKRTNELMAHAWHHLYGLKLTGLRFFTVYGPWGRPDMAYYIFAEKIRKGLPIPLFAGGKLKRDFTYVDDVTESISRLMRLDPPEQARILNIGYGAPQEVDVFAARIAELMGVSLKTEVKDFQPGDVEITWADASELQKLTGYKPQVALYEGLVHFVEWYKSLR
jgi:UDP-glucuronate 4-epimerase